MRTLCRAAVWYRALEYLAIVVVMSCSIVTRAQQRDTSAISFLTQAVTAAGGSNAITAIQDLKAEGTITHNWEDSPKQGQVTIKTRGLSEFRIDSQLPEGTWSHVLNGSSGKFVFPDGSTHSIAPHNSLNGSNLAWPLLNVAAALVTQNATIIDRGLVPFGTSQAREITLQRRLPSDPNGFLSKLTKSEYFFDPATFVLLRVQDTVYPDDDAVNGGVQRTVDFTDYQAVKGVLVPLSIQLSINGQLVWSIHLTSVAFNTGLADSDFQM